MPPVTSVASGLLNLGSVPVPVVMGTNPTEATGAVIRTGRRRVNAPPWLASRSNYWC
jgi:hypothetical protein